MSNRGVSGAGPSDAGPVGSEASDAEPGGCEASDPGAASPLPRVLVLANDLIWASRLAAQLRAAGAEPEIVRGASEMAARLAAGGLAGAVVDLTARAYDGVAAVGEVAVSGLPVLAVGQHDDAELRRRAVAAGASRVLSYRAMFERGPAILADWLGTGGPGASPDARPGTGVPPAAGADRPGADAPPVAGTDPGAPEAAAPVLPPPAMESRR